MCAKRYPALIQGSSSWRAASGWEPERLYRRVRAGWEDFAGKHALVNWRQEIMPVFANAAGPLELLPNHRYGAGWLRITCEGRVVGQLPEARVGQADPYMQIYGALERGGAWLIRLGLIRRVNKIKGPAALQALQKAWGAMECDWARQSIHTELGSSYHPNTYSLALRRR